MNLATPAPSAVRCKCVVDFLGRGPDSFTKPYYRFLVTVQGEFPHAVRKQYEIMAYGEETAAHLALKTFEREALFTSPEVAARLLDVDPR